MKIMGMGHYNKEGKPIDLLEWGKLFKNSEYKRVEKFWTPWLWVSTVWLGLDHGFGKRKEIFETMVFSTPTFEEIDCRRYATLEQAKIGHKKMVRKYMLRIDLMIWDILNLLYNPRDQWRRKIMLRKIFLKRKYWYSSLIKKGGIE